MSGDEQASAATIKVGISNYVGTATLAVIAGAVALFVYLLQTFSLPWYVTLIYLLGFGLLVISMFCGGKGAQRTVEDVAAGTWSAASARRWFNTQAILTLLGSTVLVITGLSAATGPHLPVPSSASQDLSARSEASIAKSIQEMASTSAADQKAVTDVLAELAKLQAARSASTAG